MVVKENFFLKIDRKTFFQVFLTDSVIPIFSWQWSISSLWTEKANLVQLHGYRDTPDSNISHNSPLKSTLYPGWGKGIYIDWCIVSLLELLCAESLPFKRWTAAWSHNSTERLTKKHCLPLEISLNCWWPSWMLPTMNRFGFEINNGKEHVNLPMIRAISNKQCVACNKVVINILLLRKWATQWNNW